MITDFITWVANVIPFFWEDYLLIALVLGGLYLVFYVIEATDNWGLARTALMPLIIAAEKYLGSGTGALKKELVIQDFRKRHKFMSMFLSASTLGQLIESVLSDIKSTLDEKNADLDTLENNLMRQAQDTPKLE